MSCSNDNEDTGAKAVYVAHPLRLDSSKNIRLVSVLPRIAGNPLKPDLSTAVDLPRFMVNVHTVPLESAPPYIALSYVWGPPEPSQVITLAGQRFRIRENLWAFLERASLYHSLGFLWIDALCIDQSSIPERNHQVAMMGDIYRRAKKVISWLGTGPPELVEAVKKLGNGDGTKSTFDHVVVLSDAEYWRRAWIAQEVALAQELDIWCGYESMSSSLLRKRVYKYLGNPLVTWMILLSGPMQDRPMKDIDGLLFHLYPTPAHCADVRDRIYSLLSLVDPGLLEKHPITVDYTKSPYRLFLELTDRMRRQFATQLHSLRKMADFAEHLQETLGLQSDPRVTNWVSKGRRGLSIGEDLDVKPRWPPAQLYLYHSALALKRKVALRAEIGSSKYRRTWDTVHSASR
ncbi:heterokaryon incompatibility protein-domain-containing protein [Boeremia exigua]|uniref:heterokaryon incompatibility protein-domain-containing protein n=1 Tax=Boeremia exigua TaxID=749465 RepID=UPI001E8ECEB3|nr:heterokaryon incompatibility protein-domain-containing protein [Boeremia exigua]KAH6644329.1 heterokaryon incompatibility protein-domain-containing protein [Boeremia exigua]